jgi:molybdopterin-binding protein
MARGLVAIGEAARRVGVSIDTIRRWDRAGTVKTVRGPRNTRMLPETEVNRILRRHRPTHRPVETTSARNRLPGIVCEVRVSGLLAQVTLDVDGREVTAIITRDSVEELALRKGMRATALIKASHVIIERGAEG